MSNENPALKPLTEKVLKSGIVDEHMAALMERWGYLPEGAAALTQDADLKNATRQELELLAEDIANEVARTAFLRETELDLDKLRWPKNIAVIIDPRSPTGVVANYGGRPVAHSLKAVVDRMNRYYFRAQDVRPEWFVPGYIFLLDHDGPWWPESAESKQRGFRAEQILEVSALCYGDQAVAIQVSTEPIETLITPGELTPQYKLLPR